MGGPITMAKGTAMGLWRGKKGNNVFYYLRNSRNAQKQGIRERVYEISNPQSNGQTDQRMKMLPLQRMGAVLGTIVRRSWEGVEYGGKTWQKFLSANMGSNSTLPYVDKDDDRTIPGDIQVSKGSLESIAISYDDMEAYTDIIVSTSTSSQPSIITVGELSAAITSNNPQIKDGDQLTFVVCTTNAATGADAIDSQYYWSIISIIIDNNDTRSLSDLGLRGALFNFFATSDDYRLSFLADDSTAKWVAAATVIHSRLGDNNKYLRSTQRLVLSSVVDNWFSSARHSAARRTYKRTTAAASTNWPVDPDADIEGTVPGSYTISGLTGAKASCNGKQCWVRRYEDTNELAAVYVTSWLGEPGDTLVDKSNNQAISYTSEQQGFPLGAADVTALANLPQITWDGEPTS